MVLWFSCWRNDYTYYYIDIFKRLFRVTIKITKKEYDDKVRDYIKNFLIKNKFIENEDNIIHMEKSFIAASILRYALISRKNQKIDDRKLNIYFKALSDYKLGKIDFKWGEGHIRFTILENTEREINEQEDEEPKPPRAT